MFSAWIQKWINQIAHVGWGAYILIALSWHMPVGHAILWLVAFATIKEGIFDPLIETAAEQGSGIEDWLFWMAGMILGIVSLL